ncbi:MAG TPA: amidase [Xanthobacteraceae bacterium]|jgi:Asp-tRNA(Asn)/Glu-tRNA(Gln) amidotransferase A subunit family amidase
MLSALDLARRIEAGELAPAAVIDLCAKAIDAREPEIQAFVTLDVAGARRQAEAAGLANRPLRGLPVGVKDIFDTVDFPTEFGTPIFAGNRPRGDAALVALIRRAGGIVLGKTVTTELAFLDPSKTHNPHDPSRSPGGSSSGSAASVAAGMLPIAVGTQTGGSVIRPASYCGVTGFKPSYRLLPSAGIKHFSVYLDTAGLFAARVADVAFAAAAITGRDLRVDRATIAAPRIAIARTNVWDQASVDMQRALDTAAKAASAAGARVTEPAWPAFLGEAFHAHAVIQDYEAFRTLAFEYDRHRDQLSPVLRDMLDNAAAVTAADYDAARRTTKRARQALADFMSEFDALLTPSAPSAAPGPETTGPAIFNRVWTLMGTPCVNVTGLNDARSLPLGVQIVGRFGRDHDALLAASFLENAIGAAS